VTIVLPDAAERDRVLARLEDAGHTVDGSQVRDPSGNALVLALS
jgi:hypothetical protein